MLPVYLHQLHVHVLKYSEHSLADTAIEPHMLSALNVMLLTCIS